MQECWWSGRKGKGSGVLSQKLRVLSALAAQPRRTAAELLLPGKPNQFLVVLKIIMPIYTDSSYQHGCSVADSGCPNKGRISGLEYPEGARKGTGTAVLSSQ